MGGDEGDGDTSTPHAAHRTDDAAEEPPGKTANRDATTPWEGDHRGEGDGRERARADSGVRAGDSLRCDGRDPAAVRRGVGEGRAADRLRRRGAEPARGRSTA